MSTVIIRLVSLDCALVKRAVAAQQRRRGMLSYGLVLRTVRRDKIVLNGGAADGA